MKKLYEVEKRYYVMAESVLEAASIIPNDIIACTTSAFETDSVDYRWEDAIPFNSDDDRTCSQILKEQRAAK